MNKNGPSLMNMLQSKFGLLILLLVADIFVIFSGANDR